MMYKRLIILHYNRDYRLFSVFIETIHQFLEFIPVIQGKQLFLNNFDSFCKGVPFRRLEFAPAEGKRFSRGFQRKRNNTKTITFEQNG